MNKEQIEQHLKEKLTEWTKSAVYEAKDLFICGGCIASMINDEEISDYDVYCKSEGTAKAVSEYFDTRMDHVLSNTGNAVTFNNKIQLITKFSGEPEKVIDKFDFLHTQCYFDGATNELHISERVENVIKEKVLVYTGSSYPVSTLIRIPKYIKRGWYISPVQHARIILDVSVLDLTDSYILKDQLMGVDLGDFFGDDGEIDLSWREPEVTVTTIFNDLVNEDCGCRKCNPNLAQMILCPDCGNKRCDKAQDHEAGCTDSNRPEDNNLY